MEPAMDDSPRERADRYQRLARQYFYFARKASLPFLRADYQHTAEEYRLRAHAELSLIMERVGASTAAAG
jgi:hypothetical protein